MKNISLVPSSTEPVIEGEIVEGPLPSGIKSITAASPVSLNAFGWLIGLAAGVGFIAGAALIEASIQKTTKAPATRRRPRRK